MTISIRAAEPNDYEAIHQIFLGPKVVWGTLQLPFPSAEMWRKRMAEPSEGTFRLVACLERKLVGQLDIHTFPNRPRRRHAGQLGMAVRDEFQRKGVGTALLQAAVDLADKWLNLLRLELEVYSDHEPAVRLYKRFGFAVEGTLVRYAYRAGQLVDVYAMARFQQERLTLARDHDLATQDARRSSCPSIRQQKVVLDGAVAMPTNTRPSTARMPVLPHGRRMNPSQAVGLLKQMPFRR